MDQIRGTRGALTALLLLAGLVWQQAAQAGKAGDVRRQSFELLNQGVAAYSRGELSVAVDKLRQSAALALNSFRAYYYLGLALTGDRRYPEAIEALNVALDLDPVHLQALVALGDANLKSGDIDEARAGYFRALKLRPEYAPALDGLGRSHESQADDEKAIEQYRRAIASNKGFAPAYTHLGDLYLRQERLEEAVALLEEAISIRPDYAPGLNRLALAYGKLGLHNEAVAMVQRAMELEPQSAAHPTTLGLLQLGQGLLGAAWASLTHAIELDPALPEARMGLAEVSRRRGDYDAALAQIDLALQDARLEATMAKKLRELRGQVEREHARVGELEQGLLTGGATAEDKAGLADIYAGRGMWERAATLEQQAPPSAQQRQRLAYMLTRAGHHREAERIYAELAREAPSAALLVNHGVSLALLGDDAAAVVAYRGALDLDPAQQQARLFLGNSLLRMGREREAAEAYKAFLELGRQGEAAERVRRILLQIAPELLPPDAAPLPAAPPPAQQSQARPS